MAPFREPALVPSQAVRLTALGILAEGERHYADLAREVGDFIDHILGKSLDLMGTSLELLRYEGLIEADGGTGMVDNAVMRLTDAGRGALQVLLKSGLRAPSIEVTHLVLALKLRFLPLLDEGDRAEQLALIRDWLAGEILRFEEVRARYAQGSAAFRRWIDAEIALAKQRLKEMIGGNA
jgi:DNA-binding PadR family transcriptional regulator